MLCAHYTILAEIIPVADNFWGICDSRSVTNHCVCLSPLLAKQFRQSASSCRFSDIFQNVLNEQNNLCAVSAHREAVRMWEDAVRGWFRNNPNNNNNLGKGYSVVFLELGNRVEADTALTNTGTNIYLFKKSSSLLHIPWTYSSMFLSFIFEREIWDYQIKLFFCRRSLQILQIV